MYFFGITRFSIFDPSSKAWNLSRADEEKYLADLYSEDRMTTRVSLFLEKALPAYQEMAGKYFYKHILSFSDVMPVKYKKLLLDAARKYPVLRLNKVNDNVSINRIAESFLENKESGPIAFFRVDDDDLLSSDYMDLLSRYVREEYNGMAVSFGSGIAAKYYRSSFRNFRQCRSRLMTMGLAHIGKYGAQDGRISIPPFFEHTETDRFIPVIVDSRSQAFLCTMHAGQDTSNGADAHLSRNRLLSRLSSMPAIQSASQLIDKFPAISEDLIRHDSGGDLVAVILEHEIDKNLVEVDLNISLGAGAYLIRYEIDCDGAEIEPRGLVASFVFNGASAHGVWGLTKSDEQSIGWYHYIEAGNNHSGTIKFEIFEGVEVNNIKIRPWKKSMADVTIKSLQIFSRYAY